MTDPVPWAAPAPPAPPAPQTGHLRTNELTPRADPPSVTALAEREYQQLLRSPRHRWWRPLVALVLVPPLTLVAFVATLLPVFVIAAIAGVDRPWQWTVAAFDDIALSTPNSFLYGNLLLGAFILVATLSIWIAHRVRPRFLSSVRGGLRWRWLGRCLVIVTPIWVVFVAVSFAIDPGISPRPPQWVALLIIMAFTTPLQAAGEEYLFRGWLLQNVGSYFARPMVAFVVPTVISVGAFAAAHGSADVWIIADLAVFAFVACFLTWRTGGLEAAIVVHVVNNVVGLAAVILLGGWEEAFIDTTSASTPLAFAFSALVQLIATTLILWQAKKVGLRRTAPPPPPPPPPASPAPPPAWTYGPLPTVPPPPPSVTPSER